MASSARPLRVLATVGTKSALEAERLQPKQLAWSVVWAASAMVELMQRDDDEHIKGGGMVN